MWILKLLRLLGWKDSSIQKRFKTSPYRAMEERASPKERQKKIFSKIIDKIKQWKGKLNMTWDDLGIGLILLTGTIVIGFCLWMLGSTILSSGRLDYCYIDATSADGRNQLPIKGTFLLKAHVPWRNDRVLGEYATLGIAAKEAADIDCPLETKR